MLWGGGGGRVLRCDVLSVLDQGPLCGVLRGLSHSAVTRGSVGLMAIGELGSQLTKGVSVCVCVCVCVCVG